MFARLLSAIVMLASASGAVMADNLKCLSAEPLAGSASALCSAVAERLSARSADQFELQILAAQDTHLRARLTAQMGGRQISGEELALTVMDRDTIPASQIGAFADALIDSLKAQN